MILLDASVLIDHSRTADPKLGLLLRTLPRTVCGVTRAEMFHGARTPAERQSLITLFAAFGSVPIPDALWDAVGDNLSALRAAGISVPFQDVVIATVAIANGLELWTRDQHFAHMQAALPGLRLFAEPP